MTAFQIISIASLTIILAWIGLQLFRLVRPRLTPATTLLFIAGVSLGFLCYFGVVYNFADNSLHNSAQFRLREIGYWGLLTSLGLFLFLGTLGLILLAAEYRIRQIARRR